MPTYQTYWQGGKMIWLISKAFNEANKGADFFFCKLYHKVLEMSSPMF